MGHDFSDGIRDYIVIIANAVANLTYSEPNAAFAITIRLPVLGNNVTTVAIISSYFIVITHLAD